MQRAKRQVSRSPMQGKKTWLFLAASSRWHAQSLAALHRRKSSLSICPILGSCDDIRSEAEGADAIAAACINCFFHHLCTRYAPISSCSVSDWPLTMASSCLLVVSYTKFYVTAAAIARSSLQGTKQVCLVVSSSASSSALQEAEKGAKKISKKDPENAD
jgi:hypothetical protein